MRDRTRVAGLVMLVMSLASVAVLGSQQSSDDHAAAGRGTRSTLNAVSELSSRPTPPYHKSAEEAKPFPTLVPASRFSNRPVVARAYQMASEIPGVMAQQPCYCNCDKVHGHTSLLDCYASDHTAGCAICVKETFLTFQLTKQGKRPSQIRKAIVRGDWQKIDINQPSH